MNIRRPVIGKRPKISSFKVQSVTMNSELCTQNSADALDFTADDLALLKRSSDFAQTCIENVGCHFESYQEKRYRFAKEWAEGHRWNTPKTWNWVRQIKRELAEMRSRLAAHAAPGESSGKARAGE